MTTIIFIETGTQGGGSFESLYLHLKYLNREFYNPVVVLFNNTKYNHLFASIGVEVYQIKDLIFSTDYTSLFVKILRRICSRSHRLNISILKFVLRVCHFNSIRAIKKIIKSKEVSLIHLNDQILRDLFCTLIASDKKLPCISHLRSMRSNGMTKQIADFANSIVNIYIANSGKTKNHWKDFGIDENKLEIIYNAIEIKNIEKQRLFPEYYDIKDTKLGCIANFEDAKGHDFLIRSFSELVKTSGNYKLFLAGMGTYENDIRNLVAELNLSDNVVFLGYVENSYSVLSFIDMLLVPSKNEAFGRIILEGMVSCKPVIATNIGGIPEIIKDGYNGILVEYGNVNEFSQAVLNLTNNNKSIENITENALKLVRDKFSIEEYVKKMDNIYKSVIPI